MEVIPAINETDFRSVKSKMRQAKEMGAKWTHLDVADGKFTRNTLWNNPANLESLNLKPSTPNPKLEVHLMVQNPDEVLDEWLDAKVKRVIVHLESVKDLDVMKMKCVAFDTELFIAVKSDTPVERLFAHEGIADGFLILAVNPGLAGQKFQETQLGKIRTLRQKFPDFKIEADGGVNLENASRIKEAGADILVSASYIWMNKNPKSAYLDLLNI